MSDNEVQVLHVVASNNVQPQHKLLNTFLQNIVTRCYSSATATRALKYIFRSSKFDKTHQKQCQSMRNQNDTIVLAGSRKLEPHQTLRYLETRNTPFFYTETFLSGQNYKQSRNNSSSPSRRNGILFLKSPFFCNVCNHQYKGNKHRIEECKPLWKKHAREIHRE